MKRIVSLLSCLIILILPVCALASGLTPDGALEIDPAHVYPGMEKSYSEGYLPTVSEGKVTIVLPLIGSVRGGRIRVVPDIPQGGPFETGNYIFDAEQKTYSVKDASGKTENVKAYLVTLELPISGGQSGTHQVGFAVSYNDANNMPMQQYFSVTVALGSEDAGAFLRIAEAAITPDMPSGDTEITVKAVISNSGALNARNVTVRAVSEDGELTLTSDLNGVFIERIPAGESEEAEFTFRVSGRATDGEHIILIEAVSDSVSCEGRFRVNVRQPVELAFEPGGMPDTVASGSSVTQLITIYNPSCGTAYNVHVKLDMDGVICASAYFDKILPGDQAEKELKMMITELRGVNRYGETSGVFTVTYEDSNGAEEKLTQQLKTRIEPADELSESEKAAQESEQMKRNTLSKWWISVLAAVAIIAILCSVIVVGKLRRLAEIK